MTLYFMPWVDMDPEKELRVFVERNRVTAISAQHLYRVNRWLVEGDTDAVISKVLEFFARDVRDKLSNLENYTMDVVLVGETETPYFIETNSFGAAYAAGSALFHWIEDHEVLSGARPIELRYVDRP